MTPGIGSSIEKLSSVYFYRFCSEEMFSNFYPEVGIEKCCAQSVLQGKPTSVNMKWAELGNSSVGNITAMRQMGRQNRQVIS